ncbi:glutathione peroxidase [Paenibacillus marchantiophytorum]|uniref:Glutathione peroxidase n=1 Tax=Paenibacillus marchantiophytorum TaxID=1619310 RepID=A0ABQ2BTF6_9BACL|nr:glutathione peroxidase [Paenibacillus marchantiophytorum]GGI45709.1 glutathione peroxidase [Paenibacillus marchantiophytorum]
MNVHQFTVRTIRGEEKSLADYKGQVLLIVNTATNCGLAPQFIGLQELHDTYKDQGFSVLGFPCNQFMDQEPGDDAQVQQACQLNFGVNFPLFSKINVNGSDAHPLYRHLKQQTSGIFGSGIKWNFTKFLVDQDGRVLKRFSPTTKPSKIDEQIRKLLEKSAVQA